MSTFLGIDLGTSAAKAVVLSETGEVLARARVAHPQSRTTSPGRADPAAWRGSISAACAELGTRLDDVGGVGIDAHCPTLVPMRTDGTPVGLAVTWDHPALAGYVQRYAGMLTPEEVAATGNHTSQSTFVALAYHLMRETDAEAFSGLARLGFAGTWLGGWLTGCLAVDPTQASYSGIFDTTGATPE